MKKLLLLFLALLGCCLSAAAVCAEKSSIEVYFTNPYSSSKDRTVQNMIVSEIQSAKSSIDIATYNFSETKTTDALIKALKRGVKVRIVTDGNNMDKKVLNQLKQAGVKIIGSDSTGLMHAKYIVIDGRVTICGSANMTYASFTEDNNFMFRIISEDIAKIFQNEFDEMYLDLIFGEESPRKKPASSVTLDDGSVIFVRFSPDDSIQESIEQLIGAAKESVYMLAYSFSSKDISNEIKNAYKRGLDVAVICEDTKAKTDTGGQCPVLEKAGAEVLQDGDEEILMHEKAIILDRKVVIAGSYNFTQSAELRNDEQVLIIQSPKIVEAFLEEFDRIYEDADHM